MSSLFRRKGRPGWTVKYRDRRGHWRMRSFRSRYKAEDFERLLGLGAGEAAPQLERWAEEWLKQVLKTHRSTSARHYAWAMRKHVVPALGSLRLDELSRRHVKTLLLEARDKGLKRNTLRAIHGALSNCLAAAVDDELLPVNVARGATRALRLEADRTPVKAFTLDEARAFMKAADEHAPEWALLFRVMLHAGLRIGEALALRWDDVDARSSRLTIARTWSGSRISAPKTGESRVVDLAEAMLKDLQAAAAPAKERAIARGQEAVYVFQAPQGRPWRSSLARAAFKRVLSKAGLPGHFTPHGLRHTYARLQLEAGQSVKYVQQQLGHRTITMTADLYGQWADLGSSAAAEKHAERLRGVTG